MKANRIVWINRFDDDGVPPVGRVNVQVELGEKSGANLEIQPIKFLWKNNGNVRTWSGELHCLELYENEAEKKLARIWDLRNKHQNENDSLLIPLCTGRKGRSCASRRKNGGATIERFNFREDRSTGSALALKQTGIGGLRNGFLWKKDCDICVFELDKEGGDSSALIPFRIECLEWMYFEFKGVEGYSLICVDYGDSQVCAMINDWYDIRFLSVFEEPLRAGRPVSTGELSSYDLGHAIKGVLSVLDPIEGGAKEEVEDVEVEVEVGEVTVNIKRKYSKIALMDGGEKEGDARRRICSFDK